MNEDGRSENLHAAAAVEPLGGGRFSAQLHRDYTVFDVPNGGYLQCVIANAAVAAAAELGSAHLYVTALSTNFISACAVGPVELVVQVRRSGRSVSFCHVELWSEGVVTTESLVTVGILSESSISRYAAALAPEMAPPSECLVLPSGDGMTLHEALELRYDPTIAHSWNVRSETGEHFTWMRLDEGSSGWNAWSVLFAADALLPATVPLGSSGWVPTLQLSSYVRRVPAGEWLRAHQWCVTIADGLVDERCELFDEGGELVASSSQLASVRFPQGS